MSDYIVRAIAANDQIRAFAAVTTETVETARQDHNTSPVATAALGRLLTAGAMMGTMMKGEKDILTLQIKAGGPLEGITVTADSKGRVKGYVGNPNVCIPANSKGKLDVAGAVGIGFMNVIKDMGLKEPYVGQVALQTSEIAEDLTYYFATSEQVPSAVGLGVLNDGTDFIDIIITAGPSDSFLSAVRRNGKFEFLLCNWGADYSDPETETDPFYQAEKSRGMRYAYLRTGVEDGFITGETADAVMAYMNAIEAAKQITDDIDARYKAFADAETLLITNALVIPRGMSVPAYLATRLNYWEGQYASTGFSNKRLKGIHVLDHYVSMDEYEANRDAR